MILFFFRFDAEGIFEVLDESSREDDSSRVDYPGTPEPDNIDHKLLQHLLEKRKEKLQKNVRQRFAY